MKPQPPYGLDEMHPRPVPVWFRVTVEVLLWTSAVGAIWAVVSLAISR